jgi:predicted metalloprotease with PDZ domain
MRYRFSASHPASHFIEIEMVVDNIADEEVFFQLPSWRPGRYELGNFAKNIQSWRAANEKGETLVFKKVSKDCWEVRTEGAQEIHISYTYYAVQADAGACWLDEEQLYINPIHCCLYVPERIHEPCTVEFNLPEKFAYATSLEKINPRIFLANDYHELVDSPVIASTVLQHNTYTVDEYNFHIWFNGECKPDWPRIINDFRRFTTEQIKMMGEFPVKEFHFLVQALPYKFYHGVEHLQSTVLALGPGTELMEEALYTDFTGVSSHELFHVWNVKTIRPDAMMPYNYTKENYSRLGYVYEGVTTYYGDLFLARSGVYSLKQFFKEIGERVQKHFDNYGRFNLSVADSSFDTWLDGYVPGVPNRKTSIYDEGCLVALMTDLMIRKRTNNEKSLDDVMRILYNDFGKRKRGYTENDYITIVENLTNESAADFFIDYVYGTENYEPLLADLLNHFGCELFKVDSDKAFEHHYGFKVSAEMIVEKVAPNSPAWNGGLTKGDELVCVNGLKVERNPDHLTEYFSGQPVTLTVITAMKKEKHITLHKEEEKYFPQYSISQKENPTTSEQKAFSEWMRSSVRQHSASLN